MIFFYKVKKIRWRFGIGLSRQRHLVSIYPFRYIPNWYAFLKLGHWRIGIGYNRMKRIVRDREYMLDGEKIMYPQPK